MLQIEQVKALLKNQQTNCSDSIKNWRAIFYSISVHTKGALPKYKLPGKSSYYIPMPGYMGEEYQKLFDNYLLARHPREEDSIRQWRYSQYRPFQKDAFLRLISICTGSIFQDTNYGIEIANKRDNEYIWGSNIDGSDIIRYFEKNFKSIIEDPNGLFIRIPKEPWNATTTAEIQPDVWFINTKNILYFQGNDLIFLHGGYAWHVTEFAIFRYKSDKPQGQGETWELADEGGYYTHGFGYLPIDVAGGVWNTEGYYESWVVGAKPVADELVAAKSAEQLVNAEASHPWIVMAQEDCEECDGERKVQVEDESMPDGVKLITCSTCKGSGQKRSQTPGQRLYVPAEYLNSGKKMLEVIAPPIDVNQHHKETTADLMNSLLDALNLLKVDEAQSGVAKVLDLEALHQFLSKVSNDLFDRLIFNTLRDFTAYRNVTSYKGQTVPAIQPFSIVKPTEFNIKSAGVLLNEYDSGIKAGLPAFIRAKALKDYTDKQYGGDKLMAKKADIISKIDFLAVYTPDEKTGMAVSGQATQEDMLFSARLPLILEEIISEKSVKWFLDSDVKTIKEEARKLFAEIAPAPPPITPKKDAKGAET